MTARHPYVVLHHVGYGSMHFDLLVAIDDTGPLLTWRLPSWPCDEVTAAVPLAAHRRPYLTYEGVVSGDRGRVTRVAAGLCEIIERTPQRIVLSIDEREMTLPF